MSLKELREARQKKAQELRNLVETKTGADWNEDIQAQYDGCVSEIDRLDSEIMRHQKVMDLAAQEIHTTRQSETPAVRAEIINEPPIYRNLGQQLLDVAAVMSGKVEGIKPQDAAERLTKIQNAASGMSTGTPSDGGFLVQKDFTTALMDRAMSASKLAPKCRRIQIGDGADGLEAPYIDETSRATGSRWGGVRVYRRAEAETVTSSKIKFGKWSCDLEDLMSICYITGRALRDASSLGSMVAMAFEEEASFVIDDEIFRGSGAGQCLGVLNSGALVTQAKETGQPADTLVAENVINMHARLNAKYISGAEWYVNQELLPQMQQMAIAVGTGGQLVYTPPGGLSTAPYGTLLGLPVVPIEHASAPGDVGDITLMNLGQYILIEKGGMDAQQSMHVRFLYDEMCFRFMWRMNGAPKDKSTLTPYKGSNTISPFVALAAR